MKSRRCLPVYPRIRYNISPTALGYWCARGAIRKPDARKTKGPPIHPEILANTPKKAHCLRVLCVTLGEETEWPQTVQAA